MSATNHTTNYNLPQFVGSDKPAWLGDVNPALNAIDTAMHANAVKAQQGVDDASTAQTKADTAEQHAQDAITSAGTAQETANQAISGLSQTNAKVDAINEKIQLTDYSESVLVPTGLAGSFKMTLAQNKDGSLFKVYGNYSIANRTNNAITPFSSSQIATINVGGTNYTVINLGLRLKSNPDSAFIINPCGFVIEGSYSSSVIKNMMTPYVIANTDGYLYLGYYNFNTVASQSYHTANIYPALYFNTNFGDLPTGE